MRPSEAVDALRDRARPFLDGVLDDPAADQCRALLATETWDPKTLFAAISVNDALDRHPGMTWRLQRRGAD